MYPITAKGKRLLAIALMSLLVAIAPRMVIAENVPVDGTSTQFANPVTRTIGGKDVQLVVTGVAMRTKFFFQVYAMASYIQEGVRPGSPEALATVDCAKQLHLVMERDVDGKDMAEAFQGAIRMNYGAPTFENELNNLMAYMKANPVKKGDQIFLTNVPGRGLHVIVVGKTEMMIENVAFAHAIWEIYLGRNNLGTDIKRGLTSRI
jgi:hypothetical protein